MDQRACEICGLAPERHSGLQDFDSGWLAVDSFIRPNRLFTVEHSVVIYFVGQVNNAKLRETRPRIRDLFA
jgi:hypothetical protein